MYAFFKMMVCQFFLCESEQVLVLCRYVGVRVPHGEDTRSTHAPVRPCGCHYQPDLDLELALAGENEALHLILGVESHEDDLFQVL